MSDKPTIYLLWAEARPQTGGQTLVGAYTSQEAVDRAQSSIPELVSTYRSRVQEVQLDPTTVDVQRALRR